MFQFSRQLSEWVVILTDASPLHRTEHRPSVTTCLCTLQAQDPCRCAEYAGIILGQLEEVYIYVCQRSMVVGVGAGLACEITTKTGERPGCGGLYFRTDKD